MFFTTGSAGNYAALQSFQRHLWYLFQNTLDFITQILKILVYLSIGKGHTPNL